MEILANIVKLLGDLAADAYLGVEDWYFAIGELNTILNRWVEELEALKDVSEGPEQLENLVMDMINLSPHLILIDTDFRREFLSVLRAIPANIQKLSGIF